MGVRAALLTSVCVALLLPRETAFGICCLFVAVCTMARGIFAVGSGFRVNCALKLFGILWGNWYIPCL